jgi:hypothetical protein
MRRILELFLISAMVLGSALGAQEENGVLVLDVYSINVPSDVIHEKGFALWAKALKGGEQSSHEYVPVIHAVYRLGGAVNIDKHYKTGRVMKNKSASWAGLIRSRGAWNTGWNFRSSDGRLPTTERRR